jgi:hypothetical protein
VRSPIEREHRQQQTGLAAGRQRDLLVPERQAKLA